MFRNFAPIALLLSIVGLSLAGCNTVEGLGEDTEAAGDAVEDTSNDVEEDM